MAKSAFLAVVFLGAVALTEGAKQHHKKEEGDCSDIDKEQFETLYCKAYTCTDCCSEWCKDKCDGWKEKMEESNCSCDTEPEAHTSETHCDDEADDFHEEYKDDPWEARMARSCTLGCSECCKGDEASAFLQVDHRKHHHHSKKASTKLAKCHKCMIQHGLDKKVKK